MNKQNHLPEESFDIVLGDPPGTARQIDICMAILLSNPYNFASLFNALHIFHDKILPEDLMEMDSRQSTLRFKDFEEMEKKGQTLNRDNLKIWRGRIPVYLGAENESKADPTMVIRMLNYEAINYERQVSAIQDRNEKAWSDDGQLHYPEELTAGERLSKFKKTDRVYPVVTAVLFTGDTWDCATNLNEMFTMPENHMSWIPSWPLHIVDAHKMSDEEIMAMDSNNMKFFMSMVKYSKDKNKMKEISEKYFKEFYISPQVAYLTGIVTKTSWIAEKYSDRKDETEESENMCKAFEDWEKEIREETSIIAFSNGRAEGEADGISEERKRNVLSMHSKGFSANDIAEILNLDSGEVKDIISLFRS